MDIVERLRTDFWREGDADLKEAADEIERLRDKLETFANNVKEVYAGIDKNWAKTVNPLKADNERLRQQNAKLVEALNIAADGFRDCGAEDLEDMCRAAIAKATGGE